MTNSINNETPPIHGAKDPNRARAKSTSDMVAVSGVVNLLGLQTISDVREKNSIFNRTYEVTNRSTRSNTGNYTVESARLAMGQSAFSTELRKTTKNKGKHEESTVLKILALQQKTRRLSVAVDQSCSDTNEEASNATQTATATTEADEQVPPTSPLVDLDNSDDSNNNSSAPNMPSSEIDSVFDADSGNEFEFPSTNTNDSEPVDSPISNDSLPENSSFYTPSVKSDNQADSTGKNNIVNDSKSNPKVSTSTKSQSSSAPSVQGGAATTPSQGTTKAYTKIMTCNGGRYFVKVFGNANLNDGEKDELMKLFESMLDEYTLASQTKAGDKLEFKLTPEGGCSVTKETKDDTGVTSSTTTSVLKDKIDPSFSRFLQLSSARVIALAPVQLTTPDDTTSSDNESDTSSVKSKKEKATIPSTQPPHHIVSNGSEDPQEIRKSPFKTTSKNRLPADNNVSNNSKTSVNSSSSDQNIIDLMGGMVTDLPPILTQKPPAKLTGKALSGTQQSLNNNSGKNTSKVDSNEKKAGPALDSKTKNQPKNTDKTSKQTQQSANGTKNGAKPHQADAQNPAQDSTEKSGRKWSEPFWNLFKSEKAPNPQIHVLVPNNANNRKLSVTTKGLANTGAIYQPTEMNISLPNIQLEDIHITHILAAHALEDELKNINVRVYGTYEDNGKLISQLNSNTITPDIIEITTKNKPTAVIYNSGNGHWVVFFVIKNNDETFTIWYKDSYFRDNNLKLEKLFSDNCECRFVYGNGKEQSDGTSCGILALQNLRIINALLDKESASTPGRNELFKELKFCHQDDAPEWRVAYEDFRKAGCERQAQEAEAHATKMIVNEDEIPK